MTREKLTERERVREGGKEKGERFTINFIEYKYRGIYNPKQKFLMAKHVEALTMFIRNPYVYVYVRLRSYRTHIKLPNLRVASISNPARIKNT